MSDLAAPRRAAALAWSGGESERVGAVGLRDALARLDRPLVIVERAGELALARGGALHLRRPSAGEHAVRAWVPPLEIGDLGDRTLAVELGLRANLLTGSMANGIASVALVRAIGRAGFLGFYGAAGQDLATIEGAIAALDDALGTRPFGVNLIHSPYEPGLEDATVDLLLRRGVRFVEASAFMDIPASIVRYRASGLRELPDGRIAAQHHVFAKVSRVELVRAFLSPPPQALVDTLLEHGLIDEQNARLVAHVPVASHVTVEADSGGHTDRRPLVTLLSSALSIARDRQAAMPTQRLRVGAAGGIGTPAAAAAALAMGADYIMTGSINQACVESGSSDAVRLMLAEAAQTDVTMAPAADMFEMGVELQVLRRGTMFAARAHRLREIWQRAGALEALSPDDRETIERKIFGASIDEVWTQTEAFWRGRDPAQLARAESDARHRFALVCRWYLGLSSRWANRGEPSRTLDYQVWCGPAMGAFNDWTRGSFLADPTQREVVTVNTNLIVGAAELLRAQMLSAQGLSLSGECAPRPRSLEALAAGA